MFLEYGECEFYHNGRAAYNGYGIVAIWGNIIQNIRDKADFSFPIGRLTTGIDCGYKIDIRALVPFFKLFFVHKVCNRFGSIHNSHIAELIS